jgi:putative membrane protein
MLYYALSSLVVGPLFPFALLYRYFRFKTLRYEFDDEGISMRWGILFRREISLTYARIQDIHLTSNAIERWLGLGQVQIQTASGNAGAEMTIEGLKDFEAIRDDLYARMRGATDRKRAAPVAGTPPAAVAGVRGDDELAVALHETAVELRRLREALARAGTVGEGGGDRV